MSATNTERSKIGHLIWVLAVPIVIGWFLLNVATNTLVPPLEKVGEEHTVGLSAKDGPAMIAMKQIGTNFQEFDSDSNAMIVLEGDQPLGAEAHHYYDGLVAKLTADTAHVEHVADFWSDPLTAVGSQSADGKAAYVQVYLRGNQGETKANDSVASVREIVADSKPPAGLHVFVTGGAPLVSDQHHAGDKSIAKVTAITLLVIAAMLLVVYRSLMTMILILLMVFLELGAARGVVDEWKARRSGKFIGVTSPAAVRGQVNGTIYSAAKSAMRRRCVMPPAPTSVKSLVSSWSTLMISSSGKVCSTPDHCSDSKVITLMVRYKRRGST